MIVLAKRQVVQLHDQLIEATGGRSPMKICLTG